MNSLHPVFERALRPFAPSFFPNIGAAQQAALRPDALGTQARIALSEEELLAIDRAWLADQAAAARAAAASPVDAEAHEWVQAVSRPTPEMLAAAERLRQSINQRRAERQEAVT